MKDNKKRLTLKVSKLNKQQLFSTKGGFHGSDFNAPKNANNGEGNQNND